ncbi:ABC transporter permease [Paenibacillus alvei]|uniref:ABC transporter permease n=1 Tax=Paenibacillus alvei TaxID=44250 RepID=UPI00227F9158|nr:ABC transporter permease [Paenibacillus alvei]
MISRFVSSYRQNHYLVKNMLMRDVKKRYIGSTFGAFWFFFQPIMTVAIYTFVFSFILKAKLGPEFGGMNFSIWLICGLVPWMYFNEVIVRGVNAILDNTSLITKTVVDTRWIIFSYVLSSLFTFFVFLIVIFILLFIYSVPITWNLIVLPYYTLMLGLFSSGLALGLAALNVYVRDVAQIISIILNVWFYFTPIVYPETIIPEQFRFYLELNPVYHFMEGFRVSLLSSGNINISGMLYVALFSLMSFIVGMKVFNKLKDGFADVL